MNTSFKQYIISNTLHRDLEAALRKYLIFFDISENIKERNQIMKEEQKTNISCFDIDEQTIIKAFIDDPPNKMIFLGNMANLLSTATDDNVKDILYKIINKVKNMTDEQFSQIDLSEAIDQSDYK